MRYFYDGLGVRNLRAQRIAPILIYQFQSINLCHKDISLRILIKLLMDLIASVVQGQDGCYGALNFGSDIAIVVVCCVLGLIWSLVNVMLVNKIDLEKSDQGESGSLIEEVSQKQKKLLIQLGQKISDGAVEFLKQEYLICLIFVAIMFVVIWTLTAEGVYTAFAFVVGAVVSIACGAIGMIIATRANYRTTYCAKKSLAMAFRTAYRSGCAMGFALVSLGLLVLMIMIIIYKSLKDLPDESADRNTFGGLFEAIAGYGLGGSFVALFGRVGGGIYTKAADVGADLVGKLQSGLPEDSPKNPATIADNVGDNVGDVAGMSADLFGSFAQSTCASLVISSTTLQALHDGTQVCHYYLSNLMYPLVLMALGILLCIFVSVLSTHVMKVQTLDRVERTLKIQLLLSTFLLVGVIYLAAAITYPSKFFLFYGQIQTSPDLYPWTPYICSIMGLVSGMVIAAFTEYVTSHAYGPVRQLADICKAGPASNVTLGLALGYMSTVVPGIFIAVTAYLSNHFMGYYGVSLAALGMLSNLPLSLAIDGYGPISDNAGGIAQMAEMGEEVRERTDGLDAAGNTTAAIGKGFAIGSAALVSLSLYGGFLHNAELQSDQKAISLKKPQIFAGLLLGAMLPYIFSAFTIRSVGKAAFGMVEEVRRQISQQPGILEGTVEPDYKACIRISTRASLIQMIAPGALVILSPLVLGFSFGPIILAGFLPGAIVSGIQMATSAANTGGAWDNAKKYIESGAMVDDNGKRVTKGSDIHKAAVVGDTVGDPLKDTSGPALNILIKLMAILSLVFASKFKDLHPN